jgi:pimeloyl-ACP methyl ester carboxylesterase
MRRAPLVLSLLTAALAPAPSAEAAMAFERCGGYGFSCARLSVPLDRSGAVPGRVSLLVKRVRARREGGATRPPLLVLAGGPGQSATRAFAGPSLGFLYSVYRNRDLIVYDQRGTGRSGLLRCRRLERASLLEAGSPAGACARGLGPRRAAYTTRDSVDDIEAIREELGAERISLFGTSYGTKVALGYARVHPSRVERLVLDSVVEIDGPDPFYRDALAAVPRVLRSLCQGRCGWTDDPVDDLARVIDRIASDGPLRGRVVDRRGRPREGWLTRVDVFSVLIAGDFDPALRAAFPGAIRAALGGDAAPMLRLRRRAFEVDAEPPPPLDLSSAVYAATTCEETPLPWARATPPDPAERHRQAAAQAATVPDSAFEPFDRATSLGSDVLDLCERWPHSPVARDLGAGPLPDVPVLLVEGEDDLRTPVENAQRTAQLFPRSRVVVAPATGHSALGSDMSGCALRAFARFMQRRPVPAACAPVRRAFRPQPPPPRRLEDVGRLPGTRGELGRILGAVKLTLEDVAEDASAQAFFGAGGNSPVRGGGLRAGHYRIGSRSVIALRRVSYVPGITLTGRLTNFSRGRIRVGGSAAPPGLLRIGDRYIQGRLGGRRVRGSLDAPLSAAAVRTRDARAPLLR